MFRRQGVGCRDLFQAMIIEIPDDIGLSTISVANMNEINPGWRNPAEVQKIMEDAHEAALHPKTIEKYCQPVGDEWYQLGETAVP